MYYDFKYNPEHNIKILDFLNLKFNIYYTEQYKKLAHIPDNKIPDLLYRLTQHLGSFFNIDMFKGYTIHLWNLTRNDIPKTIENRPYIFNFQTKNIYINLSLLEIYPNYLSLEKIISDIFGYIYCDYIKFNNQEQTYMYKLWLNLRGKKYFYDKENLIKLFAEDYSALYGLNVKYYTQELFCNMDFELATKVQGLKNMYLYWLIVDQYFKENKYKKLIINKHIGYDSNDFNYSCVYFYEINIKDLIKLDWKFKKIDEKGIQVFNTNTSRFELLMN